MNKRTNSAIVWKEGNLYVAKSALYEIASQGRTRKEALKNLQEAIDLHFS